jgi:anti-anti-sigma factor
MAPYEDLNEPAATVLGAVDLSLGPKETTLALVGDIDLAVASALEDACRSVLKRGVPLRIEASAMTFIDSVGVGLLVPLLQARPGGRRPVLTGVSRLVLQVIVMMGLADLVELA